MRRRVVGVLVGWLVLGSCCKPAGADGGSMRLSGTKGGYRITVFAAPTPLRAGPVDLSALVQDALTAVPLTQQVNVTIRMTKSEGLSLEYPATTEAATNKLFRAAQFELPEPGRWELQVQVDGLHGLAVLDGEVEAAESLPRWQQMWLWIGWPIVVIALFGIHIWRSDRRRWRRDRQVLNAGTAAGSRSMEEHEQ
jgi:hypothetical protein